MNTLLWHDDGEHDGIALSYWTVLPSHLLHITVISIVKHNQIPIIPLLINIHSKWIHRLLGKSAHPLSHGDRFHRPFSFGAFPSFLLFVLHPEMMTIVILVVLGIFMYSYSHRNPFCNRTRADYSYHCVWSWCLHAIQSYTTRSVEVLLIGWMIDGDQGQQLYFQERSPLILFTTTIRRLERMTFL